MAAMNDTAVVMGQSFDTAKNDALFYLANRPVTRQSPASFAGSEHHRKTPAATLATGL